MKAALAAAALILAGCAATSDSTVLRRVEVPNAGFEQGAPGNQGCPRPWYCTVHAGATDAFRLSFEERDPPEGKRAFCIERLTDEPWMYVSASLPAPPLARATVRFSIAVRAERLTGPGVSPFIVVHGFQEHPLERQHRMSMRMDGWQRLQVEARVPSNARLVEFGVQLEGGGRVCMDDARLEVLASPGGPV